MRAVSDQTIMITGATDGIGILTAHALAGKNATLLVHGRDPTRLADTVASIQASSGNADVHGFLADFADLASVRQMAAEIGNSHSSIDVLINNAGIGSGGMENRERALSRQGHELRFAVNFLAPFLLTHLLLPCLARAGTARIVNVASAGQHPIGFSDVMLARDFSGRRAYGQSKLALIMFTFELAEKLASKAITVNCHHPGSLLDTKMVRETFGEPWGKPETGAEAQVYLATAPELANTTGRYFDVMAEATANPQAYDAEARRQLWALAERLTSAADPGHSEDAS